MRVLIDVNLTARWVHCLNAAGHDAVHWSSIGPLSATDMELCSHARAHDYVVLTNDLDFPQILAFTADGKPRVVLLRGEPLVPELRGNALLNALATCETDLMNGVIVTLDLSDQPRARLLPIR